MSDNWGYVLGAYGLAAVVFGTYWLRLGRRERELTALAADRRDRAARAERGAARGAPPRTAPPASPPLSRTPRP
jgi:hypothetical protein